MDHNAKRVCRKHPMRGIKKRDIRFYYSRQSSEVRCLIKEARKINSTKKMFKLGIKVYSLSILGFDEYWVKRFKQIHIESIGELIETTAYKLIKNLNVDFNEINEIRIKLREWYLYLKDEEPSTHGWGINKRKRVY